MKVIKEDIENLERYIGNSKVDVHAELPLVMADAYSASKKAQEEIDKEMKPEKLDIEDEKVIGAEKQPVPKKLEEAKINLEESLFEDIFYPHRSADILTDMIDDGQFDYQDKLEALLKDIIYLVDDRELSGYLKKKGIYSEALREESLSEDYTSDRYYSDMLFDMIEDEVVDASNIAKDLIYWCTEDDIQHYMRVNDLISYDDFEESLKESKSSMKDFLAALSNCKTVDDLQVLRNRFDSLKTTTRQDAKTFNSAWSKKRKALKEAYDTDVVAEILSGYIPKPKRGFKYLSNNGTSGEVVFKGTKYAFREKDDGSYKVMRSSDAGSNWSETLFKDESLKEGKPASVFIDSEGNSYSDEDRSIESDNDIYTTILTELSPDHQNWMRKTKIKDIPVSKRYDYNDLEFTDDYDVVIHGQNDSDFELAKRVADVYGLEFDGPRKRSSYDNGLVLTIRMPKVD